MSAPSPSHGLFQGPGALALIAGIIGLLIGIGGLVFGHQVIFGVGLALFLGGLTSRLVRSDALDVTLTALLGIGLIMSLVHLVVTQFSSHEADHATSEPAGAAATENPGSTED